MKFNRVNDRAAIVVSGGQGRLVKVFEDGTVRMMVSTINGTTWRTTTPRIAAETLAFLGQ